MARVLRCCQLIAYDSNHLSLRRGLTPFEVFPSLTAGSRHRLPWPSCRYSHPSTCANQSPPTSWLYSISESVLHSTHCCMKHNRYSHGFAPPTRTSLQTHRPSNSSVAHLGAFIDAPWSPLDDSPRFRHSAPDKGAQPLTRSRIPHSTETTHSRASSPPGIPSPLPLTTLPFPAALRTFHPRVGRPHNHLRDHVRADSSIRLAR